MMTKLALILSLASVFSAQLCQAGADPGKPLILTPYIQQGKIKEAQLMSKVTPSILPNVDSYSGYMTVNETANSNLFFWFFPTMFNNSNVPVLIWLQGGPGASSLFALFCENGPVGIDKNLKPIPNTVSWTSLYNVIYIDNPVGTGFSFTDDQMYGYRTNESQIADDLYTFLQQFYKLFPQYLNQDLYLTGESYAGKYIPSFAYRIEHAKKQAGGARTSDGTANLAGVLIGNGWSDPLTMEPPVGYHMFNIGLLDYPQLEYFNQQCDMGMQYVKNGNFVAAFDLFDKLTDGDFWPYGTFFENSTGCTNYYNMLQCRNENPIGCGDFGSYVVKNETRAMIHVGSIPYGTGNTVESFLKADVYMTVRDRVEYLLSNTTLRMLFYSGNLDMIVPTVSTEAFLNEIDWPGKDAWRFVNRLVWTHNGQAVGYVTQLGPLSFAIVRNAGHMVPADQPDQALGMVDHFIRNIPFPTSAPIA